MDPAFAVGVHQRPHRRRRDPPVEQARHQQQEGLAQARHDFRRHREPRHRRAAEEALQQSIILEEKTRTQLETLTQLSTPLIPINDRVIIMPIIGAVDAIKGLAVRHRDFNAQLLQRGEGIDGVDA